ncbi:MAG: dTMP kinase [Candidatus Caenarcaniphilales bacterium]|nr:dTMP kinase [Candidatus Caenarcaniphilales bacterium]
MLISVEGPDQAGKTTQIKLLKEYAENNNLDWNFTCNPGGTDFGFKLRELILDKSYDVDSKAELLIYLADRAQHVAELAEDFNDPNKIVICDRFSDSTLAYQGFGRNMDTNIISQINSYVSEGIKPDLTILLMIEPEEAFRRREGDPDRMEQENKLFFIRVANGYKTIASSEPERVKIINVENHSKEHIHGLIIAKINQFIEGKACV